MESPKLYDELSWLWPILSPPADFTDEAALIMAQFQRAGVPDGGTILHLGCGAGSIDWHLKQRYQVTGVDPSEGMLEQAREYNPEVDYVIGDLQTTRLGRVYDGVLIHDAIAYMTTPEALRQAYGTAAAHLESGGVLVAKLVDVRERFQQHRANVVQRRQGERVVTAIETDFDAESSDERFEKTYVYLVRDDDGLDVKVDTHTMGLHSLGDFLKAIAHAGFSVESCLPDPPEASSRDAFPLVVGVRLGQ